MTYLKAANASYSQGKKYMRDGKYAAAARLFNHAKEMFQQHEWQFGSTKSPAINAATRLLRQSIRMRDAA